MINDALKPENHKQSGKKIAAAKCKNKWME